MLSNNYNIDSLKYDDVVKLISEKYNLTIHESVDVVKQLSLKEYMYILEANGDASNIPSPSGQQQIGGTSATNSAPANTTTPQEWDGNGPATAGMVAGIKTPSGTVAKVNITNVASDGTVTVTDPSTGEEQEHHADDLLPANAFIATKGVANPLPKTMGAVANLMSSKDFNSAELSRITELAGITETASCGATGAGAIAAIAKPMGSTIQRRKPAEEAGNKSIQGQIDPHAASSELSRRLADKKLKTTGRQNNGVRK